MLSQKSKAKFTIHKWLGCLLLTFELLLFSPFAFAQNARIDSLKKLLQQDNSPLRGAGGLDTNKVNALNALAIEFRNNNPDTAIYTKPTQVSENLW